MVKIFIASFNRASDDALSKLKDKMIKNNMFTDDYTIADYILAVGDRVETYDFVLSRYKENKKIIHLWAGEIGSWVTHDGVYRHSMTLMSDIQLCTNETAKQRVDDLCKVVKKKPNSFIVGNVMLDNLDVDESVVPDYPYLLILYNPPTRLSMKIIRTEIDDILKFIKHFNMKYIWVEPNGDIYSNYITPYITHKTFPRKQFLGLIKHCSYFITNSSCQYYEAPFLMRKDKIISIGLRNKFRESKISNLIIPFASDKIINIFRSLDKYE